MTVKPVLNLKIQDTERMAQVCKALGSESRLNIVKSIWGKPMIISELAALLNLPMSTTTMHLKLLEEAGIIKITPLPGSRGSQKLCGLVREFVEVDLSLDRMEAEGTNLLFEQDMPIGNYFDYEVQAPCGMASSEGQIGYVDEPQSFSVPERFQAQILWFSQGYLEYRFVTKVLKMPGIAIDRIEFLLELCSETFYYNDQWPSDISVWINNQEIGLIESPGDYGGRPGKLNPDWWPDFVTQYGDLHHVTLTNTGTTIDANHMVNHTIESLGIKNGDAIKFKIGVKGDARNCGGMNLFGNRFGDHNQAIVMKVYGKKMS